MNDLSAAALPADTPAASRTFALQPLALLIMAASGFAALGYQIVWTQQFAVWLGHEMPAVLAVVSAYFGGLAVGALALRRRIEGSNCPARWYAGCEALIAGWSVVLALVMPAVGGWLVQAIGEQPSAPWQWSLAFGATFVLLLPATAAMGATLPAMERLTRQGQRFSGRLPALYAANTLGAVVGVVATAWWLVPQWGLAQTAALCAASSLLCAGAVLSLARGGTSALPALVPAPVPTRRPQTDKADHGAARRLAGLLAATGCLGIAYEVLVVRVLSQVSENTVYTYAMLLAVYLVGTAIGAALFQRFGEPYGRRFGDRGDVMVALPGTARDVVQDRLLQALAVACLVGTASLWGAEALNIAVRNAAGPGMWGAVLAEAATAAAAFLLPTLVMGALFSHLAMRSRAAGLDVGGALAANTAGAALAPLVFGVWLAPAIGPLLALLAVVGGYLALVARRSASSPLTALPAFAALGLALWAPPLAFVDVPEGGRIVSYRDGAMAAVSVVADADGVSRLRIDNRQQEGSSASLYADARQALLPLLLHPAPRRALFLGLGTGVTARAAAQDGDLRVDAVELLPEVVEASTHFTRVFGDKLPPLNVVAADARRYVRATAQRWDLIVADNFQPARSGSAALYTVEHFAAVQARLAPGGLFCQWLPLHQLDEATLRSIVRSYLAVYPGAVAVLATLSLETPVLGLVARGDGGRFEAPAVRQRLATAALARSPAEFGLPDDLSVLGSFVAGPGALARFAGDAPLNTDDRPVVAYLAPRITYAPDSLPRDRLFAFLHAWSVAADDGLAAWPDAAWSQRLAAYRRARDRYLESGRDVQPTADVQRMLAQVREPLLAVLRTSPDFRPAYDPLLRMARGLAERDPAQARALLVEMARVAPARPEAVDALRALGATTLDPAISR